MPRHGDVMVRSRTVGGRRSRGDVFRAQAQAVGESNEVLDTILETIRNAQSMQMEPNFYDLLGVAPDAEPKEIKRAYRKRAQKCHPDIAGEVGHEVCVVLNEAYATLMDDELRENYQVEKFEEFDYYDDGNIFADAMKEQPYTGEPLSKILDLDHFANKIEKEDLQLQGEQVNKAVFVDEIACIGCMMCINCAPAVFRVEEELGRARVFGQWMNNEDDIQDAIDSCPVDCIHWVPRVQLAPMEYVMQYVLTDRVAVGMMMSGQGRHRLDDVFSKTEEFLKFLSEREEKREMIIAERKRKRERQRAREEMQRQTQENMRSAGQSGFWKGANKSK